MSSVSAFKLVLLSLIVMIGLQLLAKRLRLPPAAALLIGGMAMAFVPGLPPVRLDPDLVIVVFLPPLLMDGAYFSVWEELKRNLGAILLLAIGAVAFTHTCGRCGRPPDCPPACLGPSALRSALLSRHPMPSPPRPCSNASRCPAS